MAEFSKQYVDQDDRDFGWDFDILEVAETLMAGYCYPCICEGYGFISIGRDSSGEIMLGFRGKEDELIWKPYREVVE